MALKIEETRGQRPINYRVEAAAEIELQDDEILSWKKQGQVQEEKMLLERAFGKGDLAE